MAEINKEEILKNAQKFFREVLASNHLRNTKKLVDPKEFNVNPFLINYLANYLTGNDTPVNIARVLVYPRILGTSITTSFGQNSQKFCSELLGSSGSVTSGIDIEFEDRIDGRKKYAQVKAGPDTLNFDDVITIKNHFGDLSRRARTNNVLIANTDMIVGVLYGTQNELSMHYRKLQQDYPVLVGKDFWHRLTGDENFYTDLIDAFGEVAKESNAKELIEQVVQELAKNIMKDARFGYETRSND